MKAIKLEVQVKITSSVTHEVREIISSSGLLQSINLRTGTLHIQTGNTGWAIKETKKNLPLNTFTIYGYRYN
jgi:hypothetical protein